MTRYRQSPNSPLPKKLYWCNVCTIAIGRLVRLSPHLELAALHMVRLHPMHLRSWVLYGKPSLQSVVNSLDNADVLAQQIELTDENAGVKLKRRSGVLTRQRKGATIVPLVPLANLEKCEPMLKAFLLKLHTCLERNSYPAEEWHASRMALQAAAAGGMLGYQNYDELQAQMLEAYKQAQEEKPSRLRKKKRRVVTYTCMRCDRYRERQLSHRAEYHVLFEVRYILFTYLNQ